MDERGLGRAHPVCVFGNHAHVPHVVSGPPAQWSLTLLTATLDSRIRGGDNPYAFLSNTQVFSIFPPQLFAILVTTPSEQLGHHIQDFEEREQHHATSQTG
jgi:hypothetical protein